MSIESMAGVSTSTTDLIDPEPLDSPERSLGVVIGTSVRGPAFVPIGFFRNDEFRKTFGKIDATSFGKIALRNWLRYSNGSFVRILGVGDGKKRKKTGENAGIVNNAGFVVGQELVLTSSGFIGANHRAYSHGPPGRTYFLGCFMSESAGSTIFSDAGLEHSLDDHGIKRGAIPILRGVLMAPSGVVLSLSTKAATNNVPLAQRAHNVFSTTQDAGLAFGDIDTKEGSDQEIVLLLNGFKATDDYANIISASLDPEATTDTDVGAPYFTSAFNTDPTKIQEAGHYLHTHYDIPALWAVPTGTLITKHADDTSVSTSVSGESVRKFQTAFLLTSSLSRNSGSKSEIDSIGCPNFENYQNRFTHAFSPFVTAQKIGGKVQKLFRVHALSDGVLDDYPAPYPLTSEELDARTKDLDIPLKITILNILPSTAKGNYAKFDLMVRNFYSKDSVDLADGASIGETFLEHFKELTLDPFDPNFIARRIGDMHTFYNFDKDKDQQRMVRDGKYGNVSRYIRIEMHPEIGNKRNLDEDIMPVGFAGINHLVLSGTTSQGVSILTGSSNPDPSSGTGGLSVKRPIGPIPLANMSQLPLPMRENLAIHPVGSSGEKSVNNLLTWGVQFTQKSHLSKTNQSDKINKNVRSLVEYFPDFHTNFQNPWVGNNEGASDINGAVLDASKFNRNGFSLENVEVIFDSVTKLPKSDQWVVAAYRRNGKSVGTMITADGTSTASSKLLTPTDFFQTPDNPITQFLKFTFPLQGGFNGYNIYDDDKANFRDLAVKREVQDSAQGRKNGPTYSAYKKALEVVKDKNNDFRTLAVPGIRNKTLAGEIIDACEERFDTFYVMDIEQFDTNGADVQESGNGVNAVNTANTFAQRFVNSSFAAAYFPDLILDGTAYPDAVGMPTELIVPPSVAVMGALSRNDASLGVGVRPVGTTRGALREFVTDTQTKFDPESEIEKCYLSKINPITVIPATTSGGGSPSPAGPIIQSQLTTLNENAANMSRIDVRRLVIEIRRNARRLARTVLFDGNTKETRNRYAAALSTQLATYRTSGLISGFRVVMDLDDNVTENFNPATSDDKVRNIIRGAVFIKPSALATELFVDVTVDD